MKAVDKIALKLSKGSNCFCFTLCENFLLQLRGSDTKLLERHTIVSANLPTAASIWRPVNSAEKIRSLSARSKTSCKTSPTTKTFLSRETPGSAQCVKASVERRMHETASATAVPESSSPGSSTNRVRNPLSTANSLPSVRHSCETGGNDLLVALQHPASSRERDMNIIVRRERQATG